MEIEAGLDAGRKDAPKPQQYKSSLASQPPQGQTTMLTRSTSLGFCRPDAPAFQLLGFRLVTNFSLRPVEEIFSS